MTPWQGFFLMALAALAGFSYLHGDDTWPWRLVWVVSLIGIVVLVAVAL